ISKPACILEQKKYVDFLLKEIKNKSKIFNKKICNTIYFGGGTPSLLNDGLIKKILKEIKKNYNISNNPEISIECNPCTINEKKLNNYLSYGINRISFGVQSFSDDELKIIGRRHNSKQAEDAIILSKKMGFNNISVDIMIGIPSQTKTSLLKSIKKLLDLGVNHISAYMLMLEEGTPLFEMVNKKQVKVASDDKCVEMYNAIYKLLKQNGFERYEISNFAKSVAMCKHNINYWQMGEYIGFGVSAHSYYNGVRIANSDSFDDYYNDKNIIKEHLTKKMKIEECIMLGLRQACGVSLNELKKLGVDLLLDKANEISELKSHNLIDCNDNYIWVSEENFGVVNAIVLKLI
ncbi:MAG: radical SAM family heme chaperone HemW, partial [Clostridia bacterium]|nr:radical SAM family heme chaperone HemW [Clostridia bacterium]